MIRLLLQPNNDLWNLAKGIRYKGIVSTEGICSYLFENEDVVRF